MRFEGEYEIDDGYCGGARPQYFTVDEQDIDDDMSDSDLEELYEEAAQEHFEEHFERNISFHLHDVEGFVEWAKEIIREKSRGRRGRVKMKLIEAELFHKTKDEICIGIDDEMFFFMKEISEIEYGIGERLWYIIDKSRKLYNT